MNSTLDSVKWARPSDVSEQAMLERWAHAVGRPVIRRPGRPAGPAGLDELTFVVWNTNVGAGDLQAFIADLEKGELTDGRPVEHFVLVLQEVHRGGPIVPADPPPRSLGASRIVGVPPRADRVSIDVLAQRAGLALYYVPSMRNGLPREAETPHEDRGNAILSTLPLTALRAYELPLEHQRRVAIAATVRGTSRRGLAWSLDWVNVHLDPRSSRWRFHRSFGAGRARQTEWLLGAIESDAPTLVGGDFNTWTGGASERAVRHMRSHFRMATLSNGGTLALSPFLPSLRLDHVLVRVPGAWRLKCRILEPTYGSDHRGIIGRIRIG